MDAVIDVVTVIHNDTNRRQAEFLQKDLRFYEPKVNYIQCSNEIDNIGFARRCNRGATMGQAPIIGFINPDARVTGHFSEQVINVLNHDDIVITGARFGKPDSHLKEWGVNDWVCGAAFFVKRNWFELVGGFDERYIWSWEETDLIKTAEKAGLVVKSINIPIMHSSPDNDSNKDAAYKEKHFELGRRAFNDKWK